MELRVGCEGGQISGLSLCLPVLKLESGSNNGIFLEIEGEIGGPLWVMGGDFNDIKKQ